MSVKDIIDELWDKTGRFVSQEKGGYIFIKSKGTQAYLPLDWDGDRSVTLVVNNYKEADVARMFWRPDASDIAEDFLEWATKKQGMTVDEINSKLSDVILKYRNDNKDWLYDKAMEKLVGAVKDVTTPEPVVIHSTEKKHPLKSKTVWTGTSMVATGTVMSAHGNPYIGLLMTIYGFLTILLRFVTDKPVR